MSSSKDGARISTNESLRTERHLADDAMLKGADLSAGSSDPSARDSPRAGVTLRPLETVRTRNDASGGLDDAADRSRGFMDDERRRALAGFLERERAATDDRLDGERSRADAEVQSRDDFLGIVSHDLKTMLTAMALGMEVLVRNVNGLSDRATNIRHSAARIQRQVGSMSRLVGDLLDVASIEAGRLAVRPEPNDATRVVTDALEAFRPLAAERSIQLDGDAGSAPLLGSFDEIRVLQVIANLLSNAIKFSARGTRIRLTADRIDGALLFSVRDQGRGIPADMLEAVFERFRQVGPTGRVGLGLGLFISRSIVEAHGGRIWAESTVGEGTTFRLTLPDAVQSPSLLTAAGSPTTAR